MLQSTYLKNADANWIKGTAYIASPTNLYVSLHNGETGLIGSNEITTTVATARVAVTALGAIETSGNTRRRLIASDVSFGNAIASGSATHWGLWDTSVGGNFLGGAQLLDTLGNPFILTITSGQQIFIGANSLIISYTIGVFSNYFIDKKLSWFSGTAFGTQPSGIWAGLASSAFSDGSGTYVAIARSQVTFGANSANGDYVEIGNSTVTTFPNSTIIATINSAGFFDALTGGNLISVGRYSDIDISVGTPLFFNTNTVRLQF